MQDDRREKARLSTAYTWRFNKYEADEPYDWYVWKGEDLPEFDSIFKDMKIKCYSIEPFPSWPLSKMRHTRSFTERLNESYKELCIFKDDEIRLVGLRDIFEGNLRRCVERLNRQYDEAANVLKVFIAETVTVILGANTFQKLRWEDLPQEDFKRYSEFLVQVQYLWWRVSKGSEQERVRGDIERISSEFGTPELVESSARVGLVFHLRKIRAILDEAHILHPKQVVSEYLLRERLLGIKFPTWDFITEQAARPVPYEDETKITGSGRFRSDAKYLPYGRFIVNRNHELLEGGMTSTANRAKIIGRMLNEEHDLNTSNFASKQLQRVLRAHGEGRLD